MKFARYSGNLASRAFSAALLLAFGRIVTRLCALASVVVVARLLDPADYGVVALAFTVIALLQAVSETGSGALLVVKDDLERGDLDTAFTLQVLRGLVLAALLLAVAEPLGRMLGDAALPNVLTVLALSPLLHALMNPMVTVYSRNLNFRREVAREVGAALVSAAAGILAALWLRNHWALVAAALAGSTVHMLLSHWRIPYRPRLGLAGWRRFTAFGGWVAGERILAELILVAPRILIWHFLSAAALGVFTVARNLQSLPLTEMLDPIRRSLLPGFAALAGDKAALRAAFRKAQAAICAVALPAGIGMAVLAHDIVVVMLGRQWLEAVPVLQILSPALALKTAVGPVTNVAMVLNALPAALVRTGGVLLLTWPALAAGIIWNGLAGAAAALAGVALVRVALNNLLLRRLLGEPVLGVLIVGWRSIGAAGVMAAALVLLPGPSATASWAEAVLLLAGKVALGALLYGAAHGALWLVAGRPGDGAETIALRFATSIGQRLRRATVARQP